MIAGTGELLGTADEHRAYATLHPGAVYLHMGEQYLVEELDLVQRVAVVASADPDYYTQARDVTDIEVADVLSRTSIGEVEQSFGSVRVTNQVDQLRAQARRDEARCSTRCRCRCRPSNSRPAPSGGRSR